MYKIRNFSPWLVHDTQKGTQEEAVTRMKCVLLIRNNVLIIHRVYVVLPDKLGYNNKYLPVLHDN